MNRYNYSREIGIRTAPMIGNLLNRQSLQIGLHTRVRLFFGLLIITPALTGLIGIHLSQNGLRVRFEQALIQEMAAQACAQLRLNLEAYVDKIHGLVSVPSISELTAPDATPERIASWLQQFRRSFPETVMVRARANAETPWLEAATPEMPTWVEIPSPLHVAGLRLDSVITHEPPLMLLFSLSIPGTGPDTGTLQVLVSGRPLMKVLANMGVPCTLMTADEVFVYDDQYKTVLSKLLADKEIAEQLRKKSLDKPRPMREYYLSPARVFALPSEIGGEAIGWKLLVFHPFEGYFHSIQMLRLCTVLIMLALICLLPLVGFGLTRSILHPLRIIQRTIDSLAAGNLDVRISEINSGDEIEKLADSFNIMARKLDLTQKALEKQNAELLRLNQVKSNFVNMVSHELRTPLMIIKESVALLLSGIKGTLSKEQAEILTICHRNATRLHQIINDLLDISRIEAGKVELNREYINIVQTARDVVEAFKPQSEAKNITVRMAAPDEYLPVFADAKKIDHILTNLISNAFKFTYPNGSISVDIATEPKRAVISVTDTGIGIAQHNIPRIFEKFEKLDKQPLSGQGSTGLGLSIAREFVRLHKGELWVESQEYLGSKFSFSLPIFTEAEYLTEYLTDMIKKSGEDGSSFSLVALRVLEPEKNLAAFQCDTAEILWERLRDLFKTHTKKVEVIQLKTDGEIWLVSEQKKAGALLLEHSIRRLVAERFFPTAPPADVAQHIRTMPATFPEDGKTVQSILRILRKGLELTAQAQAFPPPKRLGEMLLGVGYISEHQLADALQRQTAKPRQLGEILIEMDALQPEQLGHVLEEQLGVPYLCLRNYHFDKKMLKLLDQQYIIDHRIVPLQKGEQALVVAMVNPFDKALVAKTQSILHLDIIPALTIKKEFYELILNNF